MKWTMFAASAAMLTAGCYQQPVAPANNQAADATPAPAPASANPIRERYNETMSGQPLTPPREPFQLLVTRAEYPHGYVITRHMHRYPRYVFLQQGSLSVHNYVTGRDYVFVAGDALAANILVESLGQCHQGTVVSEEDVILVAVEQVPPGAENSFPCDATAAR
jgi:quercetin dioxygenase-like cupin family protein